MTTPKAGVGGGCRFVGAGKGEMGDVEVGRRNGGDEAPPSISIDLTRAERFDG